MRLHQCHCPCVFTPIKVNKTFFLSVAQARWPRTSLRFRSHWATRSHVAACTHTSVRAQGAHKEGLRLAVEYLIQGSPLLTDSECPSRVKRNAHPIELYWCSCVPCGLQSMCTPQPRAQYRCLSFGLSSVGHSVMAFSVSLGSSPADTAQQKCLIHYRPWAWRGCGWATHTPAGIYTYMMKALRK
jgi:hypothetical protein